MSWLINGSRSDVLLGLSDTGMPICQGRGQHEPQPDDLDSDGRAADPRLLRRLRQASCGWTVSASSEAGLQLAGEPEQLLKRAKDDPRRTHGMVRFYEQNPDMAVFVMLVPHSSFAYIRRMLEMVMTSADLHYGFKIELPGIRQVSSQLPRPSWAEFIQGKPIYFSKFSCSLMASEGSVATDAAGWPLSTHGSAP